MKVLNICILLLVAVTFAVLADVAQAKSNNILTLDSTNFKAMCTKYPRILALFTASKCEACAKFGPQFSDLSKDFASSTDELVFASITCRKEEEELCKKFNIATLPTLIVIDECEQGIRYRGKYNSVAVAEFVRKYLVSPAVTIKSKDELDIFKQGLSRLGVVGYFESKDDPRYAPFIQASRTHMNQYPYGVVIDADPEEYEIHDIPAIVMYKQGKEYYFRIPRDVTSDSIVEWVNENSLLFMDTIPIGDLEELIRTSFASVGVFWLPEDYPQSDLAQFNMLKDAFPNYFFVKVYVKPSDKETAKRITSSAINVDHLPAFTFIHLTTEIYPLEEDDDFIPAHIRELLNGFLEGTARLVQKSAPLPDPEQEKDKLIKTLVFDNFYATVDQSQHDSVILMLSKRHCLKCEEVLVTLKELAEIIRQKHGEDEIVFGEYNIDENFVPEILTDLPTLFYFRAGQMNVPRSMGRNLNQIKVLFNLIKNSASFDFDVELPATIEDHVEEDISPENMGVAQEQRDPKDFLGDVEGGDNAEEPMAPWMNNPVVVSNVDDNTLQKFIDENERALIVFIENGNTEADFLEQIGILSQQYGDRIAFGKVEAKNAPQMVNFFNIKEYPALKYFSLQEAVDMRELDAFTLPSLEIFLWRHLEDYAHKFNTAAELEDYVTNNEGKTFWTPKLIVLSGVFTSDSLKNPAFRSFMKTAEYLMSSVQSAYVVTDNLGLPEEYGLASVPSLMLYSHGKRVAVLPMKEDALLPISELSQWVLDNGIPTVTEFSPYLYTNLYWNLQPLVVLFIDQSTNVDATKQIKMLEEVCTEFKGKVHCTYGNASNPEIVDSHMFQWDLNPEKLPAAVIESWPVRDENQYYPMREEVTKESLRNHINKVLNNEIKSHVRSEPVVPFVPLPEMTKVVGNSLQDFINQPDKEVLVYFTHSDERGCPSCPRVDKAAQKWAKKFSKYINVALGQFDVYRNDVPFAIWREIGQVPALLYYRSTNKQEPLKYIKSLEFKDLKDFLTKHGATLQKVKD
eukprot:TRINITY_DN2544_c0_g1_i1.p1 TRINITY_DN2544_c0_g1~~TRINITY_DN2544_c0_g1_i1.p1  ORF type:complete len:1022 (-),score=274.76 TRINITY_DN2544_c0_g1_i1:49-3114(-)